MLSRDMAGLSPLLLLAGQAVASLSIDIGPRDTIFTNYCFYLAYFHFPPYPIPNILLLFYKTTYYKMTLAKRAFSVIPHIN